jgi:uncharacterized membrane protein YphA (DoxX/SURF4 family)
MDERIARTRDDQIVDGVFWSLRIAFGLAAFFAGLDKFFNLLTHWDKYLAPVFQRALPFPVATFFFIVGIIEMTVGFLTLFLPWQKVMGWILAIWLFGIAINLIAAGFLDIAVRDIVMGVAAAGMARLALVVEVSERARRRPVRPTIEVPAH